MGPLYAIVISGNRISIESYSYGEVYEPAFGIHGSNFAGRDADQAKSIAIQAV
jgi:hypothetical protein